METELRFRLLVEAFADHAIFTLDTSGHIVNWDQGLRLWRRIGDAFARRTFAASRGPFQRTYV
ncbi:MAG: hypothetical protein JOZ58_18730 [Acetobacteraceae bacterium]|nr:hypothetical protein [Acetobacteraceae bacterium]